MKILIINPNSDPECDEIIRTKARQFAAGDFQVDVRHVEAVPKLMATHAHVAAALPEMMKMVTGYPEYDAFIVACHSDPNLDVLKEISKKPVVGIAECSMKLASMYCNGFAIISPSEKSIPKKWSLARKYHCQDLYKGYGISRGNDKESILEACRDAVERYHVDGIVLGCANYATADVYVEKELGIKVFDGIACALIVAAGMVRYEEYKKA